MLKKVEQEVISPATVGVDVAHASFEAAIRVGNRAIGQKFTLNKRGVNQLRNWLKSHGISHPHLWMEPTGHHSTDLAQLAHARGWMVTLANAKCIKHFAISQLEMNKNDKVDARIILVFGEKANPKKFKPWSPKSAAQMQLRDAQIEILGLKRSVTAERNRLKSGLTSDSVKNSIRLTIAHLKAQIKALHKESLRLIRSDEELSRIYDVLDTIRGFGEVTIAFLLAKIDFNAFSKGRQLVKFAGLNSIEFESGTSVRKRPRIARAGHTDLRAALYWPAIVAIRDDAKTAAFAQAITDRAKSKMVGICAVMARLLRVAFARVRDDKKLKQQQAA